MKPKKRNRKPRTPLASIPVPPIVKPVPWAAFKSLFEKWIAPVVLSLVIAAAGYTFFDRLSRVENILADLQKTVTELDTSYSKDSESKGTLVVDVKQLQIDVGVLKDEVNRLLLK